MRIVLICRVTVDHRPGGMPHVLDDRARALAKLGHDVHVLTTGPLPLNGAVGGMLHRDGFITHFSNVASQQWSAEFTEQCHRDCKLLEPDIVHTDSFDRNSPCFTNAKLHAITMHGFSWGAMLSQWNQTRVERIPMQEPDWYGITCEATALARFDRVLAISRHEQRMLEDQYGLHKVRLVYNPIAECFFTTLKSSKKRDHFVACHVSNAKLRNTQVAQQVARLQRLQFKTLTGYKREELPHQFDAAMALVLPTYFAQGYDLAVAEAHARGCPCIMSNTGSYRDEALPCDMLVPIGDRDAIAEALKRVRDNPPTVPFGAANIHRPEVHANAWLEAICG